MSSEPAETDKSRDEHRAQEAADRIWARINERRANVASFERWSA